MRSSFEVPSYSDNSGILCRAFCLSATSYLTGWSWELSFPHAVCQVNPMFPSSAFFQQFSLSSANLISFSAFSLSRGRSGGMIVDPLHSGFPQPVIDPSSGIPGRLPPGAVPPGARFDPFGPLGAGRPG